MKTNKTARIFSVMQKHVKRGWLAPGGFLHPPGPNRWRDSECAFLGKSVSGQRGATGVFGHFHPDGWHIWRGQTRRPQHRILSEHFAVHLGDKIILAIRIVPPDLPELNGLHRHCATPVCSKSISGYRDRCGASISPVVPRHYESAGKELWSVKGCVGTGVLARPSRPQDDKLVSA